MSSHKAASMTGYSDSLTAQRAGSFLETQIMGAHKDKRIAQAFGISPSMAKLLRRGQGWTVRRFEQAAKIFGRSFVDCVYGPITGQGGQNGLNARVEQMAARIERLETAVACGPFAVGPAPLADRRPPVGARHPAVMAGAEAQRDAATAAAEASVKEAAQ